MPLLPVTLEITPPARSLPGVLLRRARALGPRTRRVNVIQRPERWSSLEASIALREHGFEPVWHLANRGLGGAELERQVRRAAAAGIPRVLCVRGEHKAEDGVDTPRIREVVRRLRRELPSAHVSVTFNHHVARALGARRALENLDGKLEAGALGVQTQVTFELESLGGFAEGILARHPQVAVTPMLMPVLSTRAAIRLSRRLSIPLPGMLLHRLEAFGAEAGWEHFRTFAAAVARSPLYDGLAIMTPIDPDEAFAARLRSVLDEAFEI
jgi:5,10-methylenetetrahydrofolate reductase